MSIDSITYTAITVASIYARDTSDTFPDLAKIYWLSLFCFLLHEFDKATNMKPVNLWVSIASFGFDIFSPVFMTSGYCQGYWRVFSYGGQLNFSVLIASWLSVCYFICMHMWRLTKLYQSLKVKCVIYWHKVLNKCNVILKKIILCMLFVEIFVVVPNTSVN